MMRTLRITETREHHLELSEAEALALQTVGQRLIGTRSWWGDRDPSDRAERTILRVTRVSDDLWSVRAGNVIGVVVVGDLQVVVQPKICCPSCEASCDRRRLHGSSTEGALGSSAITRTTTWTVRSTDYSKQQPAPWRPTLLWIVPCDDAPRAQSLACLMSAIFAHRIRLR